MRAILALDQGTTSSRAILFAHDGGIIATAQREFRQIFPEPGWVEHDPAEIWTTQSAVMAEVLLKAKLAPGDIAAIGVTNQRETTVLWERATGRPLANAIVWQDRRTAELCDELRQRDLAPLFQRKTGLVLDAYFSGTKLKWLLDQVPGARERARRGELAFGTIDSWLIWNLTRGALHVTDASNASRTLMYNIHSGDWDDELLALLDVPRELLPTVVASSGVIGETDLNGARIPIAGIAGDQQAALFGQACLAPGLAKNTYGTGCFLLLNTGNQAVVSRNNLLTTIAWSLQGPGAAQTGMIARSQGASDETVQVVRRGTSDAGDKASAPYAQRLQYALEGSVFIGGAVVQWLRDGLHIIRQANEVETLAASVPDNGGVYVVPAFTGLGAPHWDAYARGSMFGLTRGSTAAHIARAALEAIAYQSADLAHAMEADADIKLAELRVDGGAAANNLLMQFQADILSVPVVRPKVLETTALGAAYLAGLAVGYWRDTGDIERNRQIDRRFEPAMSRDQAQTLLAGWTKAVERAKAWA